MFPPTILKYDASMVLVLQLGLGSPATSEQVRDGASVQSGLVRVGGTKGALMTAMRNGTASPSSAARSSPPSQSSLSRPSSTAFCARSRLSVSTRRLKRKSAKISVGI
jgi:hypothetical protein